MQSTTKQHNSKRAGAKDISAVVLGEHLFRPWYSSSYPKKLVLDACCEDGKLYVCDSCFKYTPDPSSALAHQKFCPLAEQETLGTRVYNGNEYAIYEVDGAEHTLFCQSLCLFAKLFLDTKSICYEVQSFLFYILVETSPTTARKRVLGFFSKEKVSWDDYNLACILVFPPFQRRGLGKLMISFSYELSKIHKNIGSPEKPLSDLGRTGYIAYWTSCITQAIMQTDKESVSVNDLSLATYIQPDDIRAALESMGVLVGEESAPHIRMDLWKRGVDEAYAINPKAISVR